MATESHFLSSGSFIRFYCHQDDGPEMSDHIQLYVFLFTQILARRICLRMLYMGATKKIISNELTEQTMRKKLFQIKNT